MKSKTTVLKQAEVTRNWHIVDASSAPLGRLSTAIATKLIGKDKANFTPHVDNGDYVVVVNADNLVVTGTKLASKKYYRHSGHPGNLKTATLSEKLDKDSTVVVEAAVRGMLPKNKLQKARLARLKVYAGQEHAHTAQSPTELEVK